MAGLSAWILATLAGKVVSVTIDKLIKIDETDKKFHKIVDRVCKDTQREYPDVLGGSVEYFFKDDDIFQELMKLLFQRSEFDLKTISSKFDTSTLPANFLYDFIKKLKVELLKDRDFNKLLSDSELYLVIKGMEDSIEDISKDTSMTSTEVRSIKQLIKEHTGDLFPYDVFLNKYKENAINNLSQINFIGLGVDASVKRERKNIQDVFVQPIFEIEVKTEITKSETIDSEIENIRNIGSIEYKELFLSSNKLIVLGNPGSGKSLLVNSLICDILNKNNVFLNSSIIESLPLKIELRKYLAFKKSKNEGLIKYISHLLENDYGINNTNENIIIHLLKNNNCILFFDGLDEIFKIEDKINIRNDIENFHNVYQYSSSLTTSRIIGYEDASLNPDLFSKHVILKFNNNQIEEYVNRWYFKEEDNEDIRKREVEGFLERKHEINIELISNPLLLSLIVILYRNALKLPDSKLEIYQSCTKTLVDKWDASKELVIDIENSIYKGKDKILADLAYWQYEQLSSESVSITFEKAKRTVSKTLTDRLKLADDFNCEDLANSFLEYAQKRSIYFDNNFTHKTFLEYYAAYWIYSNIEKKHDVEGRDMIISKYISNSFWHIVIELLLNMIDKDQADCDIMDSIFEKQVERSVNSLPFILSTIFSYINVSSSIISNCIYSAIHYLLNNVNKNQSKYTKNRVYSLENMIFEELSDIYSKEERTRLIIIENLTKAEKDPIEDNLLVYKLYLDLSFNMMFESEAEFVFELSNEIEFNELLDIDIYLYFVKNFVINNNRSKYLDKLLDFIDTFGVNEALKDQYSLFSTVIYRGAYARYITYQLSKEGKKYLHINFEKLNVAGLTIANIRSFLLANPTDNFVFMHNFALILDLIDIEKNIEVIKILLLLFFNSVDLAPTSRKNTTNKMISEAFEKNKKKKILHELYNLQNINDINDKILSLDRLP